MSIFKEPLNNKGRADFGAAALAEYFSVTRSEPSSYGSEGSEDFAEAFGDLLCDLQHLARRSGADFTALLAQATLAFDDEVAAEEADNDDLQDRDGQVYKALTNEYGAFETIVARAGDADGKATRESLLRLRESGKAEIAHGLGWRRTPDSAGRW